MATIVPTDSPVTPGVPLDAAALRAAPPTAAALLLDRNPLADFASVIDALSVVLLVIPPLVILLLVGVFPATIGNRRLSPETGRRQADGAPELSGLRAHASSHGPHATGCGSATHTAPTC